MEIMKIVFLCHFVNAAIGGKPAGGWGCGTATQSTGCVPGIAPGM